MQKFQLFLIIFILASCSTGGLNERLELKKLYEVQNYEQGLKFLDENKYYQGKNEALLKFVEKGMFLHSKGDYLNSNIAFEQALEIVSKQFTVSISSKTEKGILNDNYDVYYGDIFEHSMIYFYSALNSILIYQEKEDRNELFKARAKILAWDSYLNSIKSDRVGKSIYKRDLLLKIFGAKIHEVVGTREDTQIALVLYKDALDVLYKNYNTYPSFNLKYLSFKNDYEKLVNLKETDVKKNYVEDSIHSSKLKIFLEESIKRLSKKSSDKESVTIVFEKDIIAEKIADKTQFGLEGIAHDSFLNLFVADILGMTPNPGTYNPGGVYAGMVNANAAMHLFTFSFEIPKRKILDRPKPITLNVIDLENKLITSKDLLLINPLGDIAEEAIYESSKEVYTRVGARLAAKHLAAILASYATYKSLGGGKKDNYLANNAAVLQYAAASRLIAESEKADTRFWSTLPNEIRMVDIELNPGEYKLEAEFEDHSKLELGTIKVLKNDHNKIIKIRK